LLFYRHTSGTPGVDGLVKPCYNTYMTKRYIYLETTEWPESTATNNVYVFDKKPEGRTAKCVAYVPQGQTKVQILRTPLVLDLRGRTFKELG
jgi:hypothetical protein